MKSQPEIKYEDYKQLIFKIAWKWSKRTGWDWQELMAEGNLTFVQARNKYSPSKSRFTTYLTRLIENHYIVLINGSRAQKRTFELADLEFDSKTGENQWVMKKNSEPADIEVDSLMSHSCSPERMATLKEMVTRLSRDAQMLVECTLETPKELVWMAGHHNHPVRMSCYTLQRYFVQKKSWSNCRFWDVSKEIRQALATL